MRAPTLVWVAVYLHSSYAQINSPPIISADRFISIPENTVDGTVIGTVNVTDMYSNNDTITVDMSPYVRNYVNLAVIREGPGYYYANIVLKNQIDYESLINNPIILSFFATDGKSFVPSSAQIQLYIQDVNDNPPRFSNQPYMVHIPESLSIGSLVYDVIATDTESGRGGLVYYSLLTHTDTFRIDNKTGRVILIKELDFERLPFYHILLNATDGGGLTSQADMFVTVEDVQDTPPYITGLPYITTIPEGLAVGGYVFQVSAQDGDRGNPDNIIFLLENTTCPGIFTLNSSGLISLNQTADRDSGDILYNNGICTLTVKASEVIVSERPQQGNNETTASKILTITIEDKNDNLPAFSAYLYTAFIKENMPAGFPLNISALSVADRDQGDFARFSLRFDTYSAYFDLAPSTIQGSATVVVTVKNSSILDYEERQNITLMVSACQSGSCQTSATIVLFIENTNDNSPVFEYGAYSMNVLEGKPVGTIISRVLARDKDLPPYGSVVYAFVNDYGMFAIDSQGKIMVASVYLDREDVPLYHLNVEATDSGGRKAMVHTSVFIDDVNDNAPLFHQVYAGQLKVNGTAFIRPITIHATDADSGRNRQVSYSIRYTDPPGWESHFNVDKTTGKLSVTWPLDYDKLHSGQLVLVVRATDSGDPALYSDVNVSVALQGSSGKYCERDPCYNKHCLHGGVCNVTNGSGLCVCQSFYTGDLCQYSPCSDFNCSNGGICTMDVDVATCLCPSGFIGPNCETSVSFCQQDSCLNNGVCTSNHSGFICTCPPGFTGTRCEHAQTGFHHCPNWNCHHQGTCIPTGADSYRCNCDSGFSGRRCQNVDAQVHTSSPAPMVCQDHPKIDCSNLNSTIRLCDDTTRACQYCPRYCGMCDTCKQVKTGPIIG